MEAPGLAGWKLRAAVALAENGTTGGIVARKFLRDVGVDAMREAPVDCPPDGAPPGMGEPGTADALAIPDLPPGPAERSDGFPFETAAAFAAAYLERAATPVQVAERILAWARESDAADPPLRVFIAQSADDLMEQARASAARHAAGAPLGPLDGVPIAVKDEIDQRPYPSTVGTTFLGREPCAADAEVVARLRRAGALLIGKANMHEIGMGVTGINPHHGAARNPYDPARVCGGSSSGPAAAVAAGFCPAAIGADGGGSVRIPAALCGLVGLKPTFGRVSERGAAPLCWSLAHIGPLAASARDAALAYAAIAGPDPADPNTLGRPRPTLDGFDREDLAGLRLGIDPAWFDNADPDVVATCRRALDGLRDAGAVVVEVAVPGLAMARTVHLVTIASEMRAAHLLHHRRSRTLYGLDVRLNLALVRHIASADYVHAQRHRARLRAVFREALRSADAILTPTTTCTAPLVAADALRTGESNLALGDRIMRNCPAANLTGLPAISFPVGHDGHGLPVGLQAIGRPWEEHVLLGLARAAERFVELRRPRIHRRLLA